MQLSRQPCRRGCLGGGTTPTPRQVQAARLKQTFLQVRQWQTDKTKTFCVYDAPSPEAIHLVSKQNGLPVDSITEVGVLDPYAYL